MRGGGPACGRGHRGSHAAQGRGESMAGWRALVSLVAIFSLSYYSLFPWHVACKGEVSRWTPSDGWLEGTGSYCS